MSFPRPLTVSLAVAWLAASSGARAQVRVESLVQAARTAGGSVAVPRPGDLSVIVELPRGSNAASWGLPAIGERFSVLHGSLGDLEAVSALHPDWRMTWSPPLRPLLDRAARWINAPTFRNATGLSGKDVVVGVVDTGIDASHADFRNPDGTTRIAYLVDFSGAGPGHSTEPGQEVVDAESRCRAAKLQCRVYSRAEIDAALSADDGAELPSDDIGHGTHVASLAAGNGGRDRKYVGVAPDATLIVARAVDASGNLADANVLVATDLAFSLSESLSKANGTSPATVVNLSLGSDFGPHDGSSSLERALEDLVGDGHPGRAIVVAAGNSGGLVADSPLAQDRLGVHTDVHVAERSRVRIPLVARASSDAKGDIHASIDVWLSFRPGDDVSIGFERNGGEWIEPQPRGFSGAFGSDASLTVKIVNGPVTETPGEIVEDAAVLVSGTLPATDTYALLLEGHGTASLWIQGEGDLAESAGGVALLRGATRESTVTLPAASPAVISVGATLNRVDWFDRLGSPERILSFGSVRNPPVDTVAFFSSAGPTTDGRMKPDVVAPGAFVAGAMSRDADPATSSSSIFVNTSCTPIQDCGVVDADHAVTLGTSMAAPVVSGAVALLLGEDPTRTTERLRALLQAGARRPTGATPSTLRDSAPAQGGAGVLDLEGIRAVEHAGEGPAFAPTARSWLTLGATYAHPDPGYPVPATLSLRDDQGHIAAVDAQDVELDVTPGAVTGAAESPAPGFVRFSVAAARETGGDTLTVSARYHGELLATASLPIAVDVNVAKEGFFARGGCAIAAGADPDRRNLGGLALVGAAVGAARTRRRRQRADSVTAYACGSNGSKSGSNG
ncbi:MAG TPA: S8 family serine peptidase [Polyangiaceae bacterium]|nr:S8 family serine peptidase [Polyangiaceae bacterium]